MNEKKHEMVKAETTPPAHVEGKHKAIAPRYEIAETEHGFTLTLEMPGVSKDTLDIQADRDNLRVSGRRAESWEGLTPLLIERPRADYVREFSMDDTVDWGKISASVNDGIVIIDIPKASHAKRRKIQVS